VKTLTNKQKVFVNEYLKDLNATRAYKTAYKNIKSESMLVELKRKIKEAKEVLYSEENDQILALIKDETSSKNIEIIHFLLKKDGVLILSYERIYDPKTLVDGLKPVLLSEARNFMLQMPKVEAR